MAIRLERQKLYEDAWSTPLKRLAAIYGVPTLTLRDACIAMDIPLPRAGHWTKAKFDKAPPRPALPPTTRQHAVDVDQEAATPGESAAESRHPDAEIALSATTAPLVSHPEAVQASASAPAAEPSSEPEPETKIHTGMVCELPEDQQWLIDRFVDERSAAFHIAVPVAPTRWHPAVAPLRAWLEERRRRYQAAVREKEVWERQQTRLRPGLQPEIFRSLELSLNYPVLGDTHRPLVARVSADTSSRALAILNALAVAAKRRGFRVALRDERERLRFSLEAAHLDVRIAERLTEELRPRQAGQLGRTEMEKVKVPAGQLRVFVEHWPQTGACVAEDRNDRPIEEQLHRIFEYAYRAVIQDRQSEREEQRRALAQERRRQEAEIRRLQREEEERRGREEQERRDHLIRQANEWDQAERIRAYVSHVVDRRGTTDRQEVSRWRLWALGVANDLDPTRRVLETRGQDPDSAKPSNRLDGARPEQSCASFDRSMAARPSDVGQVVDITTSSPWPRE